MRRTICLDAGHGGNDPGAAANGMREADITLEVAGRLARLLCAAGHRVILARPGTAAATIAARWQLANRGMADYFVSVQDAWASSFKCERGLGSHLERPAHVNAGRGTGAETFFFRENTARGAASAEFARQVIDTYAREMGLRNRGAKADYQTQVGALGVLRNTAMPAILVETAFIDSPAGNPDVPLLRSRRKDIAAALCAGIQVHIAGRPPAPPAATVDIDILGTVRRVGGYIAEGATFVRLTDFGAALGYAVAWDGERRLPMVRRKARH